MTLLSCLQGVKRSRTRGGCCGRTPCALWVTWCRATGGIAPFHRSRPGVWMPRSSPCYRQRPNGDRCQGDRHGGAAIEIGAGEGTMIDINALLMRFSRWAIGGRNWHIGAGAVLAGVIDPAAAQPVTVGEAAAIGATAWIFKGVRIGCRGGCRSGSGCRCRGGRRRCHARDQEGGRGHMRQEGDRLSAASTRLGYLR